jgi:hypothetical protein
MFSSALTCRWRRCTGSISAMVVANGAAVDRDRRLAAEAVCASRPWEGSELSKLSRSHQAAPEARDKSRLPKADYCSPRLSSEIRELSRSPAATQHHGAARLAAVRCG